MAASGRMQRQLNGGATDWIIRTVIAAALVWGLNELSEMRRDIAEIQGDRFTDADGSRVEGSVSELRAAIERKADKDNVPPPEVIRWLERIEQRIRDLEQLHRTEDP